MGSGDKSLHGKLGPLWIFNSLYVTNVLVQEPSWGAQLDKTPFASSYIDVVDDDDMNDHLKYRNKLLRKYASIDGENTWTEVDKTCEGMIV